MFARLRVHARVLAFIFEVAETTCIVAETTYIVAETTFIVAETTFLVAETTFVVGPPNIWYNVLLCNCIQFVPKPLPGVVFFDGCFGSFGRAWFLFIRKSI